MAFPALHLEQRFEEAVEPTLPLAAALAQAAETIDASPTYEESLQAVVRATTVSLPQFQHVSLSVRRSGGRMSTAASSDELALGLDHTQYALREGPCVDAVEEEPFVVVDRLPHEQRWPQYIPFAASRGVRSQLAVRLFSGGTHVGGLNLYSSSHDEVGAEASEAARLFATHAAILLGHAQQEHQLNQALQSRKLIGQAIGILMERYELDEERAFQFLMRASSTSNVKLRDVAAEVVSTSLERYARPR